MLQPLPLLRAESAVETAALLSLGMRRAAADLGLIRLLVYYGTPEDSGHPHDEHGFDPEHPEHGYGGGVYPELASRAHEVVVPHDLGADEAFRHVAVDRAGRLHRRLARVDRPRADLLGTTGEEREQPQHAIRLVHYAAKPGLRQPQLPQERVPVLAREERELRLRSLSVRARALHVLAEPRDADRGEELLQGPQMIHGRLPIIETMVGFRSRLRRRATQGNMRRLLLGCIIAGAIVLSRLVLRLASPADWSGHPLFSSADYAGTLLRPLLTSPFDFLLTAAAATALTGLLLFAVEARRVAGWKRRRLTRTGPATAAYLGEQLAAGAGLAAVLVEGVGKIDTSAGMDSDGVVRSAAGPVEIQAFLQDLFTGTASSTPIRGNPVAAPEPENLPQIEIVEVSVGQQDFCSFECSNTGSLSQPDDERPCD